MLCFCRQSLSAGLVRQQPCGLFSGLAAGCAFGGCMAALGESQVTSSCSSRWSGTTPRTCRTRASVPRCCVQVAELYHDARCVAQHHLV